MLLPDGTWVLGPGDSSEEIRRIKAFMRRMYASYAGHLADTGDYDQQMYLAVLEMERRLVEGGKLAAADGFIGYSTKIAMGYLKPPDLRPRLHTVGGTGTPWWVGPGADIGRDLGDRRKLCVWRPCGYPAAPFPMWSSALQGVEQLVTDITESPVGVPIWAFGYSQGAIVWSLVYKYEILGLDGGRGRLKHRAPDLKRAYMFANPMREEGAGGTPGAGALTDRMVNTPPWWREYAHPHDIYASVPTGPGWGENIRAITKIVMGNNWYSGRDNIFEQLFEIGINPFTEGWAAAQSVIKAGLFFASGTGPHVQNLPVAAATDYFAT